MSEAPGSKRKKPASPDDYRATLVEHIEELRSRLFKIAAFLSVGIVAGWFIEPFIYKNITELAQRSLTNIEFQEAFRNFADAFLLKIKLSIVVGVILSAPFIVLQLWGFVSPALHEHEKKPIKIMAPISIVLFFTGCVACYMVLPQTFAFFGGFVEEFPGAALFQEPGAMVFFVFKMMLAFGLGFQLPVVMYVLAKLQIVTTEAMLRGWRQALVAIFVVSAIITPSGDMISMSTLAVPLSILYIGTIAVVSWTERVQRKRELLESEKFPVA